jgi:hypothetical protein
LYTAPTKKKRAARRTRDGSHSFFVLGDGDSNYVARRGEWGVALLRTIGSPVARTANALVMGVDMRSGEKATPKTEQRLEVRRHLSVGRELARVVVI